jgi:hypothetical protein
MIEQFFGEPLAFLEVLLAICNARFVAHGGLHLVRVKANIQPGLNGSVHKVRVEKRQSFKVVACFYQCFSITHCQVKTLIMIVFDTILHHWGCGWCTNLDLMEQQRQKFFTTLQAPPLFSNFFKKDYLVLWRTHNEGLHKFSNSGKVLIKCFDTKNQIAGIFTKALPWGVFEQFRGE